MKKTLSLFVTVALSGVITCSLYALPSKADYPHWNFQNKQAFKELVKIDNFIKDNANKGLIATFDWDGTLYDEHIPLAKYGMKKTASGQSLYHIWAAHHLNKPGFDYLYPTFRTTDHQGMEELINKDNYFEGRLNVKPSGYNKFSQIGTLEAGMTPVEFSKGVDAFLNSYPPDNYAYYPMLDVIQKLINSGFSVWIVTGSNPYFLAPVIKRIENTMDYKKGVKYNFNITAVPFNPKKDKIVGNEAKILPDGKFSSVYDNRYVKKGDKLYIVDKSGKALAIKSYIEKRTPAKVVFCGGNSGGDVAMMKYVISKNHGLCIAVNPDKTLTKLVKKDPQQIIKVNMKSKY